MAQRMEHIETDYLVVGAGAMGLAFADEVITRDPSANIVIVDRHAKPGGHWNDAYPFVSLHQPAAYYGVNSLPLGAGGSALASGDEVLAYFGAVMQRLTATGRVRHFSMCEYAGEGRFTSLIEPDRAWQVRVRRKTVDATYMNVQVPSTTPPKYSVEDGATLVPINGLAVEHQPRSGYVIIGAGKTGIDAVLFLLDQGVEPDRITWIMSNDAWMLRRERIQPGRSTDFILDQFEIITQSRTLDDIFANAESRGVMSRLDPSITPTKFRCATVSDPELEQLRRVRNIVRLGRVVSIGTHEVVLDKGTLPTDPERLHVDCTADGLAKRPARPVFAGSTITLQSLLMCQQVMSAALIGYLETRDGDDDHKNALSQVAPHPEWTADYVTTQLVGFRNLFRWQDEIASWLWKSRLSALHHEPRLTVLRASFRARRLRVAVERSLESIRAQQLPEAQDEFERIELRRGDLRFTAHAAGMDQPATRPCVLCLHGFPDDARSYRFQLPALAKAGYRVLSPMLRGYEPSSQPPDGDYTVATLAEDVLAWLDQRGEDRVHLVGHDWGAAVAYAVASLAPQRLRSLTTLAVPNTARFLESALKVPAQVLNSWYIYFFQLRGLSDHAVERDDWALVRRLWRAWSPGFIMADDDWAKLRATFEAPGVKRAMLQYYRQNASPSAILAMGRNAQPVAVPTLAITGVDDGCLDTRLFDHAFRDEDFPQGFRIERIADAGHFVHIEKPETVNRLLLEWFDAHSHG